MANISEIVASIYDLSDLARKEGLLALEEKAVQLSDPFLQKGISLIVDGSDPELTKDILESEMDHKYENAKKQIQFWKDLGSYAPAWGMVGKFPFFSASKNTESSVWSRHINYYFLSFKPSLKASPTRSDIL